MRITNSMPVKYSFQWEQFFAAIKTNSSAAHKKNTS